MTFTASKFTPLLIVPALLMGAGQHATMLMGNAIEAVALSAPRLWLTDEQRLIYDYNLLSSGTSANLQQKLLDCFKLVVPKPLGPHDSYVENPKFPEPPVILCHVSSTVCGSSRRGLLRDAGLPAEPK